MIIPINIVANRKNTTSKSKLVGNLGENEVTTLAFTFSDDWNGTIKTIVYKTPAGELKLPIDLNVDNTIEVDGGLFDAVGTLSYTVYGSFGNDKVINASGELLVGEALVNTGTGTITAYTDVIYNCKQATTEALSAVDNVNDAITLMNSSVETAITNITTSANTAAQTANDAAASCAEAEQATKDAEAVRKTAEEERELQASTDHTTAQSDHSIAVADKEINAAIDAIGSVQESYHRGIAANNQIYTTRCAISMHFDDGYAEEYANIFPALLSRHLVAGFAIVENYVDNTGYLTTGQILEMQTNGMEIMSHTQDHISATVAIPYADFIEKTHTSAQRMRSKGFNIQSLVMPGTVSGADNPIYFDSEEKLKNKYADILRRAFRSFHSYIIPHATGQGSLPHMYPWGYGDGITLDGATLASLKAAVDIAISVGGSLCMCCHGYNIGKPGKLSLSDFGLFLDYLVEKINIGALSVLTPTGMTFCRKGAPINQAGDIEYCTTANPGWYKLAGGATVETTGGHTGNNFVKIPYAGGGGALQVNLQAQAYRSIAVKFWAKAPVANSKVTLSVMDLSSPRSFYVSSWGGISKINEAPISGGSGYSVGDLLTLSQGSGGIVRVVSVDANGSVTRVCIWNSGLFFSAGSKTCTGGTGSGCQVSVTDILGSTPFQGNTLTVGTSWMPFYFTFGFHDIVNLGISFVAPGNLDQALCIDDVEVYFL